MVRMIKYLLTHNYCEWSDRPLHIFSHLFPPLRIDNNRHPFFYLPETVPQGHIPLVILLSSFIITYLFVKAVCQTIYSSYECVLVQEGTFYFVDNFIFL